MANRPPPPKRPSSAAAAKPAPKKIGANVIILAIVLMVIAFSCGYGALVVQAGLSQPVAGAGSPAQTFTVSKGESTNSIIDRLEKQHIIRNGLIFKLYLRLRGKSLQVQEGTYYLSPSMHLQDVVTVLNTAPSTAFVSIQVVPGSRLLEYPAQILATATLHNNGHPDDGTKGQAALPNFKSDDFISLTKSGNVDGLDQYWYVKKWDTTKGALTALEGYLIPETYYVQATADTATIIKTMIRQFGYYLCPGPDDAKFQYVLDQTACMAHQATITVPTGIKKYGEGASAGQTLGVFDALKKYYGNNTPTEIQQALTIASLGEREARSPENFFLVDSSYYNRFKKPLNSGPNQTNGKLNADPAFQYFFGTDQHPWPTITDVLGPGKLPNAAPDKGGAYNLYSTKGLPPSAISGPSKDALYGAFFPPTTDFYYFFFSNCDKDNHYYLDYNKFQADMAKASSC